MLGGAEWFWGAGALMGGSVTPLGPTKNRRALLREGWLRTRIRVLGMAEGS